MIDAVKHTPGPWRVEEGTALVWGDCNPDDTSSYGMGYPVAECRVTPCASWAKGPRKYEEGEANARLIAASPELLEASKKVLVAWSTLVEGLAQDDRIEDVEFNQFMEMRAAVAKAVGIEPWEVGKFLASEAEGR